MHDSRPGRRVAIVAGLRTPFAKSGTVFRDVSATALARHAARELLYPERARRPRGRRGDLRPGGALGARRPNVAREVSLLPQLLAERPGLLAQPRLRLGGPGDHQRRRPDRARPRRRGARRRRRIALRHPDAPLAPLQPDPGRGRQGEEPRRPARRARPGTRPRDLVPVTPGDRRAVHRRDDGAVGREDGQGERHHPRGAGPVRAAEPPAGRRGHGRRPAHRGDRALVRRRGRWTRSITADNGIRADTSLEALAQLRPVFDRRYGTVTAGNSSPLTDGAAAVLLMAEEKAAALGYEPLAYLRSYAVAAVDPGWQLLMGPVYAVPRRSSAPAIAWDDLGLVEIHEAFAAQVLSNVQAWGSQAWAERLGLPGPVGEVDWERTNVMGGSIAIGHPFGATGARLVTTLAQRDAPARRAVRAHLHLRAGRHGSRHRPGARLSVRASPPPSRTASRSSPSTCPASRSTR